MPIRDAAPLGRERDIRAQLEAELLVSAVASILLFRPIALVVSGDETNLGILAFLENPLPAVSKQQQQIILTFTPFRSSLILRNNLRAHTPSIPSQDSPFGNPEDLLADNNGS